MKKYLISIAAILFSINSYPQLLKTDLANKIQITYKDVLELKLQILAMQITSGTYRITDKSKIEYPVAISINYQNKIVFDIEKELKNNLSKEAQKSLIEEGFNFVKKGIAELISNNYPELNMDYTKEITGYWYLKDADSPCAKWENGMFQWITN